MPITPATPYPKNAGQTIRSSDWNQAVDEIIRLDRDKVDRSGDTINGPLTIDGNAVTAPLRALNIISDAASFMTVKANGGAFEILLGGDGAGGIVSTMTNHDLQLRTNNGTKMIVKAGGNIGVGTLEPQAQLHVTSTGAVGPFSSGPAEGRLEVSGPVAELGFYRRTLASKPDSLAAGDRFVWYNQDGNARLFTEVTGNLLTVSPTGNLTLLGNLTLPTNPTGIAQIGKFAFNTDPSAARNLKLIMHSGSFISIGQPVTWEFLIGSSFSGFGPGGIQTTFSKMFSINQKGDMFIAGAKNGYVVDYFINRVGEVVEQGDVVVIGKNSRMLYYGSNDDVPIPEVDLTDQAYDTRVCGIVASFVPESDLPFVEPSLMSEEEAMKAKVPETFDHPYKPMAASADQTDRTKVHNEQIGRMATLGTYAHCKVNADIAPIQAGDLLTTSPTKGHAQKVLDSSKALGAIIGKALAPLKKGKGKVPVLVMMQ